MRHIALILTVLLFMTASPAAAGPEPAPQVLSMKDNLTTATPAVEFAEQSRWGGSLWFKVTGSKHREIAGYMRSIKQFDRAGPVFYLAGSYMGIYCGDQWITMPRFTPETWTHIGIICDGRKTTAMINGRIVKVLDSIATPASADAHFMVINPIIEDLRLSETAFWFDQVPTVDELVDYAYGDAPLPGRPDRHYTFNGDLGDLTGNAAYVADTPGIEATITPTNARVTYGGLLLIDFVGPDGNSVDAELGKDATAMLHTVAGDVVMPHAMAVNLGSPTLVWPIPADKLPAKRELLSVSLVRGACTLKYGEQSKASTHAVTNHLGVEHLLSMQDVERIKLPVWANTFSYGRYWHTASMWTDDALRMPPLNQPVQVSAGTWGMQIDALGLPQTPGLTLWWPDPKLKYHIFYRGVRPTAIKNTPITDEPGHLAYTRAPQNIRFTGPMTQFSACYDADLTDLQAGRSTNALGRYIMQGVTGGRVMDALAINSSNIVLPEHLTPDGYLGEKHTYVQATVAALVDDPRRKIITVTTTEPHGMHSGQRVSVTCNGQTERYPAIKLSDTTLELSRKNSMTIVNAWAENPTATLVVGINGGVCIENIARAANELHMTDVMLSLPHASTDEANVAIVTRLLAVLNPDTRLWVEYSNEVWNFGGPYLGQFNYASRLAEREGITFAQWKGRKTVELEHLLKPLAPDRLRMVIAGQFDVPSQLFSPTAAYAAAGGTDAAGAVASYYTWPLADAGKPPAKPEAPEVEAPVAWSIYRDHLADYAARQDRYLEAARRMAPDQVIDALSLDVDNEADVRAAYQKWMRETGRPILGYEGGFYPSHLPADQKVIDAVHAAINTRRFGLLQAYAMKAWADAGFYCWNESAHCISEHSTRPEKPSLSATISDRYHLDTPRRVIIETVGSN